jgi:hypothetical protein
MLMERLEPRKITIHTARVLSGHKLKDAAAQVDISESSLRRYERVAGEMPLRIAEKLLQLYGFSVDDVEFTNEQNSTKGMNKLAV